MFKKLMNLKKIFLSILLGVLSFFTTQAQEVSSDESIISAGESTFKGNCSQCHQIWKVRIGPALNGVYERRTTEWLISWIKNSQAMIASGDEQAVALWEEYDKTVMPAYPFSDSEIMEMLAYIKSETIAGPPTPKVDTDVATNDAHKMGIKQSSKSFSYLLGIILCLTVVLITAVIALIISTKILIRHLRSIKDLDEIEKELVHQKVNIPKILKSTPFIQLVVFTFTIVILKTLIDGAFTIGVQQGYQPTQPIPFSHKIHAGQYEIDCVYCHTGVNKSKLANIPSPNICMICHSQVRTKSEEIKKIYAAIDYDPDTKTYGTNTKPIEWIRVHNLPDLAYFNHSQHVKIGGIACETCHGPVQEMDVIYQYSPLTMGWCINCHKETDVNTKGNGYYDKLVKLHSSRSKEPMKVEDIGGLECAKCHY